MLYFLFVFLIILIIVLYRKLSSQIELEAIKQHNGILLEIKRQLDVQDERIKQLFRGLNISMIDTTPVSFDDDLKDGGTAKS